MRKLLLLLILVITITEYSFSQNEKIVDQIVAIVGDKTILQSDIENQAMQLKAQGYYGKRDIKCEVLEELLSQKLLLNQAELDSLEVGSNRVESELDRRLMYFVRQIGSEKKLEEYYNKTMLEIKEDFRGLIHDQLLTSQMQQTISAKAKVTPKEVKEIYKNMPEDSLPMINAQIQLNQVVMYPSESELIRQDTKSKLLDLRERILNGERFSTLAILYSEDPGTARKGGELGFRAKEELDPAFARMAFSLKKDQVSRIVESSYGYHIIKLIAREGKQVNVRHILIKPDVSITQRKDVKRRLDSVATLLRLDSLDFKMAAFKHSDDEQSKLNEGLMINPRNSSTKFQLDELPREEFSAIKDLQIGVISKPFAATDKDGKVIYKIVRINSRIEEHKASIKTDYELIEQIALGIKKNEIIKSWIDDKQEKTYIHIDDSFIKCNFEDDGWIK
ncbi:MAG: peptidylprolyl isomerase [Bacteroidota bacterium]|nr:peptidylprolyl isomerase [Bacteroidota bacterium]